VKAGAGHAKGSAFERLCCKRLSRWLSHGERDDLFWRSAMSGGRATLQLRQDIINKAQSGDMTAISAEAYAFAAEHFIECKHYKDLGFGRGLICQTGTIWTFWQRACREAAKHGKIPILIARQNLYPIVAIVPQGKLVFGYPPRVILPEWKAEICLFEPATEIEKKADERPSDVNGQPVSRPPRPTLVRHV